MDETGWMHRQDWMDDAQMGLDGCSEDWMDAHTRLDGCIVRTRWMHGPDWMDAQTGRDRCTCRTSWMHRHVWREAKTGLHGGSEAQTVLGGCRQSINALVFHIH